jgi:hypothetical protein
MSEKMFTMGTTAFTEGYADAEYNLKDGTLAPPSKNCRITLSGEVVTRLGYEDTLWDLNETGKKATSHYMPQYNVTFFALNGKVKYIEHDRNNAIVDTGLSLTTTETTRFADYAGDLYLINPTDGLRQIHVFRLNDAAPNAGDATFTIDQDGGGRLNAFGDTSGNIRIRGTNESYSAVTTAGVVTHSTTLSQTYADNDIAITVEDISSGKPKGSKIVFWKERMIIIGVSSDTNVDNSPAIAYMSQFASGRDLQKIIVFGITGGATEEQVAAAGKLTNIISTRDYLYYFTNKSVHFSSVADVNEATGATYPQLLSSNYGCVNEDCAVDMGNGLIAFLTPNKRVIGIRISEDSGKALVFPDEKFDQPMRNTLDLLDSDQSNARMIYHVGKRLLYVQCSVQNVILTLVNDNNIGKWLPPDDQKLFNSFFEKDGILYANDLYDDSIYEIDRGITDNDLPIECVMAHGSVNQEMVTCEWKDVELSGSISQDGSIQVETPVNEGTSTNKTISSSGLSFVSVRSLGDIAIGDMLIGNPNTEVPLANWGKKFRITPTSYGSRYQTILSSTTPFTWKSYRISASALSSSVLTTA